MREEAEKKIPNRIGDKTHPCFTPHFNLKGDERAPSNEIRACISPRNDLKTKESGGQPIFCRSMKRLCLLTISNALAKSTKATCSGHCCPQHV